MVRGEAGYVPSGILLRYRDEIMPFTAIWTDLSIHTRIGEGNGNPLQYSYLGNPRDRGAWWAAIYGVRQSRTRLKLLSSSISGMDLEIIILSKIGRTKTTAI